MDAVYSSCKLPPEPEAIASRMRNQRLISVRISCIYFDPYGQYFYQGGFHLNK